MENCYKILGVLPTASAAEIKRAYRKKVKDLHPDTAGTSQDTEEFHKLVKAYEILSDIQRRAMFDMSFATSARYKNSSASEHTFDYRKWLLERNDFESRAKLIFFDLLHGNEDAAVEEFIKMTSSHINFFLYDWFTREDFMDFGFILCEELVLRSQYYDAALLLIQIIAMEKTYPYFKHFFEEVLSLAKDVLLHRLEENITDELALDAWEKALEINLGKEIDAAILIKMAKIYSKLVDMFTAQACFEEALHLDKNVKVSMSVKKYFEEL